MKKIRSLADLEALQQEQESLLDAQSLPKIIVGMGTCGIAAGAREVLQALQAEIDSRHLQVEVAPTGCIGMCEQEPLVDVQLHRDERITYGKVTPELAKQIVVKHIIEGRIVSGAALARLTRKD